LIWVESPTNPTLRLIDIPLFRIYINPMIFYVKYTFTSSLAAMPFLTSEPRSHYPEYVPEAKTKICAGKVAIDGSRARPVITAETPVVTVMPLQINTNILQILESSARPPHTAGEAWMFKQREVL
jgi:hypothetical protein